MRCWRRSRRTRGPCTAAGSRSCARAKSTRGRPTSSRRSSSIRVSPTRRPGTGSPLRTRGCRRAELLELFPARELCPEQLLDLARAIQAFADRICAFAVMLGDDHADGEILLFPLERFDLLG